MTQNSSAKNTRFSKSRLAFAIAAQMLTCSNALAGPSGAEVVGGVGNIEQQGTETTVTQTSDKMAIDWQSFDVGKDERVTFVQPGQSAVALNRILSSNGSEILGQIDANGHVILVNPHGVVFGEGAVVNAGGLIASGLQINPDDFMNGDLVFKRIEGTDGTVINAGMINAASGGNVALIGTQVENRGLISAHLGSVILASGKEAVLTFDESGLLGVQVDEAILQSELGDKTAVTNSGELKAEGGRILLSASTTRDVFSQAVNWGDQKQARSVTYNEDGSFTLGAGGDVVNSGEITVSGETAGNIVALGENVTSSGEIRADATKGVGGNVELHSNTTTIISEEGIVTANAERGGDIKILGKNVGLFDNSGVEASGENGGGQILVGGDQEGLNNQIRNADFVYINENASINASATESGDGGRAIVFAEDTARIHGNLSARGGELEGGGGFVETSGKKSFSITASPDVSAVNGVAGHWLINPYNIMVVSGDGEGDDNLDEGVFESSPEIGSTISAGIINKALNSGGKVTLKTGPTGGQDGNITISSSINLTENKNVTLGLIAHNNIEIKGNITAKPTAGRKLNVNLNAGGNVVLADGIKIETSGGDFVVGEFDANKFVVSNVKEVKFGEGAAVDVTGTYTNDEFKKYFPNATGILDGLAPSGRILIGALNDIAVGNLRIKGRDSVDENTGGLDKIKIVSVGGNITFFKGFVYDNNPTEIFFPGEDPNSGYSTVSLEAGGFIDVKKHQVTDVKSGSFISERADKTGPDKDERPEHQDRLRIVLKAKGDISIDGDVQTRGGDFEIVSATNVYLKGRALDASSWVNEDQHYGFGDISIAANKLHFLGDGIPYVANGGNFFLAVLEELVLPSINADGDLSVNALSARARVSQMASSKIEAKHDVLFVANKADIKIDAKDNVFGGSVWVEEAGEVELFSVGSLQLGRDKEVMSAGSLKVTSEGSIGQIGALRVGGESEFSANEDVTLSDPQNQFASLAITKAKVAEINNSQKLTLTGVKTEGKLDISVIGDLEQRSAIEVSHLVLDVSEETRLQNPNNRMTQLSGVIAGGEIVVSDDSLRDTSLLVDLAVNGEASIKARQVNAGDVLLSGGAALTFNDVGTFSLSGSFTGVGATANSVTINGRETNGNYTIAETAFWDGVKLIFNGAGGINDTLSIGTDGVTVGLADESVAGEPLSLVALNIEKIEAKKGANNTLVGASSSSLGYEWNINSNGENTVKDLSANQQVGFKNFSVLKGGTKDDEFKIDPGATMQSVLGGDGEGRDTLSYASWSGDFAFEIGEKPAGIDEYGGLEVLKGNGRASLKALKGDNLWKIDNGDVSGTFRLSDGELAPNGQMVFQGFTSLVGGEGVDEFEVKLANHLFEASYTLNGGGVEKIESEIDRVDRLTILDGGDDWEGFYRINESTGKTNFSFKLASKEVIRFDYENMGDVIVDASLDQMNLVGKSGQEDKFKLGQGWWDMNGSLVSYGSRLSGLVVDGGRSDTILLSGRDDPRLPKGDDEDVSSVKKIHLPKKLDLKGLELSFDENILLETDFLTLRNFERDVGSEKAPLNISVGALALTDNNGALYLREAENVVLAGLSGGGLVDLSVQLGDLMQGIGIEKSGGDLIFRAASGSILLRHENNAISVPVTLEAADGIELYGKGDLTLAGITAQDLRLEAIGDITSDAFIMVGGETSLVSGGNIKLDSKNNYLNRVTLHAVGNAELTNNVLLTIFDTNIGGELRLDAPGVEFQGLTNARTLTTINTSEIWLAGTVITVEDAYLNGARVFGPQTALRNQNGRTYGAKTTNATDRMIEVESLAEVDPAIFSDVKNYFYQDVSIRLPSDQLYDDF